MVHGVHMLPVHEHVAAMRAKHLTASRPLRVSIRGTSLMHAASTTYACCQSAVECDNTTRKRYFLARAAGGRPSWLKPRPAGGGSKHGSRAEAPANLPSLLTLLLALDRRHTPPLLAGCGWLRSWDACPHRRSCALRVGSLCASCARLFAGSAAWRSDSRAHARTQTVSFSEAGNTYICSLKTRFTQITHSVRTDAIYRVAHTTTSSRTNS